MTTPRQLGALRAWRRQIAAGERSTTTYDALWAAACWEMRARELQGAAKSLREEVRRNPAGHHVPGALAAAEEFEEHAAEVMRHAAARLAVGEWFPFNIKPKDLEKLLDKARLNRASAA